MLLPQEKSRSCGRPVGLGSHSHWFYCCLAAGSSACLTGGPVTAAAAAAEAAAGRAAPWTAAPTGPPAEVAFLSL